MTWWNLEKFCYRKFGSFDKVVDQIFILEAQIRPRLYQ